MNQLFKKPKDMRWVDLAMWIDDNFYKQDCDYNTAYEYMYLLASMLAAKRHYFSVQEDYEEFAASLAYDTYKRMSDETRPKIKSVLNYMKSIMSFRRAAFNIQKRQKIIDPQFDTEWDSVNYVEMYKEAYEASNRDILFDGVTSVLKLIPQTIRKNIPKVYKLDLCEYENIYISCMLSMLNKITLPQMYESKLNTRLETTPSFDEVKYYKKYLDDEIILWHLDSSKKDIIRIILNKVNNWITNEIKSLSNDIKISDTEFANIMTSGFSTGGANETDY